jgi:uncharacterized protein
MLLTVSFVVYTICLCGLNGTRANEKPISKLTSSTFVMRPKSLTHENDRFDYGEQRFVTLGLLRGITVSIVHTETEKQIRIISFRKATRNEEAYLFKSLQN